MKPNEAPVNPEPNLKIQTPTQADLRARLVATRRAQTPDERKAKSEKISSLLEDLIKVKKPKRVATFIAIQNEVDIQLQPQSYSLVYPRVEGERISFYETDSAIDQFEKSPLAVPEPPLKHSRRVDLDENDLVLVPGVVFNFKGQRIGMGKGFYDRFLAQSKSKRWGVGFGFQLIKDQWDSQAWDQNVDLVVTENFATDIGSVRGF